MTQQRSQGRRPRFWFLINSAFQGDNLLLVLINNKKKYKRATLKITVHGVFGNAACQSVYLLIR